ncbi:MAG: GNAT family N-acetyltransferase [Candidatus Omnitrophica bacterium CG11_big_fil_rev_8_21_14_0_20_63_9]|nr:MAG: GNAT family N-acetyltransferase [Candidatus Omnitrophica bacterium CG11_big_fil_rev_8_21_14_0_20_63_9]
MLTYERIQLRPLAQTDTALIIKWRNDPQVMRGLHRSIQLTAEEHLQWFDRLQQPKELRKKKRLEFVIETVEGQVPIGTVGLSGIDHEHRRAEYGILIGEERFRKRGYAKEATIALLNYAFGELNLWRVYLRVMPHLEEAIGLYTRIGFIREGLLRNELFRKEQFEDVVVMSLLRPEWERLAATLTPTGLTERRWPT